MTKKLIFKYFLTVFATFFLTGCGPKILYQEKCQKEYQNLDCRSLENEYRKFIEKVRTEQKLKKIKEDPSDIRNMEDYTVDRFGGMYYTTDNIAVKEYKWRLQTLKELMLKKGCKNEIPKEDIEVHVYTLS